MRNFLVFLLSILLLTVIVVWLRYGGGDAFQDFSTEPLVDAAVVDEFISYSEPIGNIAVSADGRVFFTTHPQARPQGNKLLEWVAGAAIPFPSGTVQPHLFDAVLGLVVDQQQLLWTVDHGSQGFGQPRLLAFDIASGELVHDHSFRDETAPAGSFLHDLRVSPDGRHVVIADGSVLRKDPALVVYDVEQRRARRVLESDVSLVAGPFRTSHPSGDLSYLGGLFVYKSGLASIDIDGSGQWLYYGAYNQPDLYRVPLSALLDPLVSDALLRSKVERFSNKPISDGLVSDASGNLYIADVEHNAVSIIDEQRNLRTLVRSPRIRWPSALYFAPDGSLLIADSAFPELVLKTRDHILSQGPFSVYRIERTLPAASQ